MTSIEQALNEAADFLQTRMPLAPTIGIVLGTGLSSLAAEFAAEAILPYRQIPHFPACTVETHTGNLLFGWWKDRPVVVLQGRVHYYEGYSLHEVVFPIRLMRRAGVSTLIITNAAGGLDPQFLPGEIMVITDHINLMGDNPLRGSNVSSLGLRFTSMHEPYCTDLIAKVYESSKEREISLRRGVYVAVAGPSLETAAETRFLRMIGADAVGMSTVPEVIAAVHAGMRVLGLSIIANVNIPESLTPAPLETVVANVAKAGPDLVRLIEGVLERIV